MRVFSLYFQRVDADAVSAYSETRKNRTKKRGSDSRQVRKVSLVLQPLAGGRDLVRRALATDPQQAGQVFEFELRVGVLERGGREVRIEGSEKLETSRGRRNSERGRRLRGRKSSRKVRRVAFFR